MSDIIDRIDELVDDQLANYHNRSGYDHNVNQDKCWHCGRDWHGLAITEKIASMATRRRYDEDYRYADDDSPVLCPGSEFIGPLPESSMYQTQLSWNYGPGWRTLLAYGPNQAPRSAPSFNEPTVGRITEEGGQ